ncbi:TetR/AcrR family transcriptional regulator [Microbacterium aquilitoris]|uniref:TetR/AcrR family transcriptional regulator n=1 Tax=Microbacterium aquilitoris TaxID=3067307 RepID=UPI00288E2A9A|nr:helix-turn-helix domain-containing protein [Microbacterium sp. KSW2-22]MDT3345000.1 helix-turn-helix domain-containing protein [Microbacterium sp. KSW2-22]
MSTEEEDTQRHRLRETILLAASELIAEGGAAAMTTRAVAVRAGVQAPTIYRLFEDKQGLVRAVAAYVLETYARSKDVADDDADPVVALRTAWRAHIDFGLANPGLYLLMNDATRANRGAEASPPSDIPDVLTVRVRAVAAAGVLLVTEERAVDLIRAAGDGVIRSLLTSPADAERMSTLSDDMLNAILGRIVEGRGETSSRPVDALLIQLRAVADELTDLSAAERALLREWVSRGDVGRGSPAQDVAAFGSRSAGG